MKTMILATAATLTLGLASAHAQSAAAGGTGGGAPNPNTFFTQLPGVIAKSATGHAPAATTTQTPSGRPVPLYANRSSPGAWRFEPEARID